MYKYSRGAHTLLSTSLFLLGVILPQCFPGIGTGLFHACFHTEQESCSLHTHRLINGAHLGCLPHNQLTLPRVLYSLMHLCKMGKDGKVYVAMINYSREQIDPELLCRQRAVLIELTWRYWRELFNHYEMNSYEMDWLDISRDHPPRTTTTICWSSFT